MDDGLFSNFKAGVLPKRQELQPDELLAEWLPEYFTHAREQLDSDDSVLLVWVVMGHLYDMS